MCESTIRPSSTGLVLPQYPDDLFFREPARLHVHPSQVMDSTIFGGGFGAQVTRDHATRSAWRARHWFPGYQVQRLTAQQWRNDPQLALNGKTLGPLPSTPEGAPAPVLGERSGAPSGSRLSSFVMCNTPVEVQLPQPGVSIIRAAPQSRGGARITFPCEQLTGPYLHTSDSWVFCQRAKPCANYLATTRLSDAQHFAPR